DASVPRAFGGRTFFFRVGRHAPWPWLEAAGVRLATLDAWGSVVTSALDLAVRAGCSPIVFAGLDLAFTRGQPYCRHTPLDDLWTWQVAAGDRIEDLWAAHRRWRPTVPARAIEGGDTETVAHLVAFRDWIRDYAAARPHIRFVNATGAGILHGTGIEVAPLDDLARALGAANGPDVAETVGQVRSSARPPAQAAGVLARVTAASPLDLLDGHSDPRAAAERIGLADVLERIARAPAPSATTRRRPPGRTPDARPASGAPFWLPDAARGLRALDPGHREQVPDRGEPDPARARARLDDALDAIRGVLSQALDATGDGPFHDVRADAWADVPAVVQVAWPPDVRALVERATAALHDALRHGGWPVRLDDRSSAYFVAAADPHAEASVTGASAGAGRVPPFQIGVDALIWQWARVAAAALDADAALGRVISGLRASRPPLLPSSRARSGLHVWLASASSDGSATTPVVPFLHGRAVMRAATGLLTLDPASLAASSPVPPASPAFHLFALPASWAPDEGFLRTRHVPWSTIVEPDVLTDRGLPGCRLATSIDERQALVTRFDGAGSFLIDDAGRVDRAEGWPRRIDGEIRCGASGRLAWSWDDGACHVLFRQAPGQTALAWELPVAPMHALEHGEAGALLATTDGLWRWQADTGPQPLAAGAPLVAVHRRGTDVRACPVPTVLADGSRQAIDRAFDWNEGAAALTMQPIAPGEACLASSTQGGWTAETWMDASAVRLAHASGATCWLACSGPRSAAWAGRSLVITLLGRGDVLLFRNLLDRLEPVVAGSTGPARRGA
ncbi:MAG TPA: hypothetical protein VNR90_02110, partial [Vicinamibacterales bacterium]|nr:hypothetical protein [Vicinamibacterales bacterium]